MYYVNFLEKGPTEYKQYINQRQQGGKKGRVRKKSNYNKIQTLSLCCC